MVYIHSFLRNKASCKPPSIQLEFVKLGITPKTQYNFPFMKREYSSSFSMTPQNSYESDQENEQINLVKPCEFGHHHPLPRVPSKSTTKEATHQCKDGEEEALQQQSSAAATLVLENTGMPNHEADRSREDTGRERLKRHRIEIGGRVWIPDIWGQEELLKDWIDCSVFDAAIMNSSIMSARAALVEEGRRAHSRRLKI